MELDQPIKSESSPSYRSKRMVPLHGKIKLLKIHGPTYIKQIPTNIYDRFEIHKRIMGHLAPSYCVCFDQTGEFVFSGADDHLIKIWCTRSGRLIKTLRGHEGQVCDMSVSYDNRLLASAGVDKIVRVWDLRSSKLLECLPVRSTITSVKFAPYNRHGNDRYLISTSNDGTVRIWVYHHEKLDFKVWMAYKERNRPGGQLTCSSFSTGGSFMALGASDNAIHVYGFHPNMGPYSLTHQSGGLSGHEDKVDSIQFCNYGYRFISGSKDGTARIWTFKGNQWRSIILDMDKQLNQKVIRRGQKPPTVLIVQWSRDDRYVMTSLVDYSIKVWDSKTGNLKHILKEHKHDVYLIESHPKDPRIFVSAGHDGYLCIWDIETGKCIKKIVYPPNVEVYDAKFSPDGDLIVTTDSHGYITFIGTGSPDRYSQVPEQMFFRTDYQALIRDANHFVMDDNTHLVPHLMPRPQLVDMNGLPHPPRFQRLVPDHRCGERFVIQPMDPIKLRNLANLIEHHSILEDEDYLFQKRELDCDSDDTILYDSDTTETYYDLEDYAIRRSYTHGRHYQTRSTGRPTMQLHEPKRTNISLRPRPKRHCSRVR
jgi:WD40 repeat protein